MLTAYADESFADVSIGRNNAIEVSAFGGYVAAVEEWNTFNLRWHKILNDYDACVFHFREWAVAAAVAKGKRQAHSSFDRNPYCGWKEKKLTSFLYALAEVAGTRKQGTFGGFISVEKFKERQAKGEILIGEDYRNYCLKKCFSSFIDVLNQRRPHVSEPISFVWDGTKDTAWKRSIIDAYEPLRKNNPTFVSIAFADDRFCLPLQAADMVSYRIRQKMDKRFKGGSSEMSHLDKLLFGDGRLGQLGFFR